MSENAKIKLKEYLSLFLVFLKLGAFTFGGGYAMISLLEHECVEKRKWLSSEDFFKIITVAETTPGPIAINSATYIGYTRGKVLGSFLATFAVVLPSFLIIFIISLFFNNLLEVTVIANAFKGIKVGVSVLILFSGVTMMKQLGKRVVSYILLALAVAANLTITLLAVDFSTIYLILIGGAVGFVAYLISNRDKLDKRTAASPEEGVDATNSTTDNDERGQEAETAALTENDVNMVEIDTKNIKINDENEIKGADTEVQEVDDGGEDKNDLS